jgi:hypothetical protein
MYRHDGACEKVTLMNFWDVSNFALKFVAVFLLIVAACAVVSLLIQCCCCCCSADVENSKISNDDLKNFDNLKFQNDQNCPNRRLNNLKIEKNNLILS